MCFLVFIFRESLQLKEHTEENEFIRKHFLKNTLIFQGIIKLLICLKIGNNEIHFSDINMLKYFYFCKKMFIYEMFVRYLYEILFYLSLLQILNEKISFFKISYVIFITNMFSQICFIFNLIKVK